jgi:hypothetical protein
MIILSLVLRRKAPLHRMQQGLCMLLEIEVVAREHLHAERSLRQIAPGCQSIACDKPILQAAEDCNRTGQRRCRLVAIGLEHGQVGAYRGQQQRPQFGFLPDFGRYTASQVFVRKVDVVIGPSIELVKPPSTRQAHDFRRGAVIGAVSTVTPDRSDFPPQALCRPA